MVDWVGEGGLAAFSQSGGFLFSYSFKGYGSLVAGAGLFWLGLI